MSFVIQFIIQFSTINSSSFNVKSVNNKMIECSVTVKSRIGGWSYDRAVMGGPMRHFGSGDPGSEPSWPVNNNSVKLK